MTTLKTSHFLGAIYYKFYYIFAAEHLKIMDKTFGKLNVGEYIARVDGYKVETAKVLKIDKVSKNKKTFLVKGTESKKTYTFEVENTTNMFGLVSGERYYADHCAVSFLRDGILIGFEYARKRVVESFKPVYPFFTVNERPVEEATTESKINGVL